MHIYNAHAFHISIHKSYKFIETYGICCKIAFSSEKKGNHDDKRNKKRDFEIPSDNIDQDAFMSKDVSFHHLKIAIAYLKVESGSIL